MGVRMCRSSSFKLQVFLYYIKRITIVQDNHKLCWLFAMAVRNSVPIVQAIGFAGSFRVSLAV